MGLETIFSKVVESVFTVFNEAVKQAQYIVVTDDGWDTPTEVSSDIRIILDTFQQEDVKSISFNDLIQPTDVKGLVPGKDIIFSNISITTSDYIQVDGRKFTIVSFDTDPMKMLYILLLRDV